MGVFDGLTNRFRWNDDDDEYDDDDLDEYEDDDEDDEPPRKSRFNKKRRDDDDDEYDEPDRGRTSLTGRGSSGGSRSAGGSLPAQSRSTQKPRNAAPMAPGGKMQVRIIKPSSFDQARQIADTLLAHRTVLLNLEGLDVNTAQRIVDFASGSCYALHGNFMKISHFIIVITPEDVDIAGDIMGGAGQAAAATAAFAAGAAAGQQSRMNGMNGMGGMSEMGDMNGMPVDNTGNPFMNGMNGMNARGY